MAFVLGDRVRETTTTVGTGDITLGGAFVGFQSFAVGIGDNNSTYYAVANLSGSEWEVGIGTYSLASNTLTRDTVLSSSNSGALVSFGAGTKDIICTMPAGKSVFVVDGEVTAPDAVLSSALLDGITVTIGSTPVPVGGASTTLSDVTLINPSIAGGLPVAQGGTGSGFPDVARVNLGVETSATGSTKLAAGTLAQRDGAPQGGYIRFNTETGIFEGYDGSTWVAIAGGASGSVGIGTTLIPLGGSSTTLTGLTSVTTDAAVITTLTGVTSLTTEAAVITTRATNAPSSDNDLSFDMAVRNNFTCTPSAPGTLTFTNITAGQSGFILLDNSGGHTISAAATTKVSSGFLTAVSTAGVYLLSYFSNGTNVYVVSSGALA